ncbi:hypothetical protein SETIT_5G457600v2, partial [Setaria italica]
GRARQQQPVDSTCARRRIGEGVESSPFVAVRRSWPSARGSSRHRESESMVVDSGRVSSIQCGEIENVAWMSSIRAGGARFLVAAAGLRLPSSWWRTSRERDIRHGMEGSD